ncbi:MAG: DNA (cytosine-5-)-methyltransferase [Clostridium sp.]|jgi:DNA-cytosine methyltransferase|nr:DNA (cytosine-5-)-methyltransferase [Clostridium sp.]
MKKQIHIRVDEVLYEKLNSYSRIKNSSMQDIVHESIVEYFADKNTNWNDKSKFTFIDLFAGIGGMRIAFEQCGGRCVFSSEWDKYCQKTYLSNFGEKPEGDITKVDEKDIPDHDILVAGFPCQPFSIAGVSKKNSLGRKHGFLDKAQGTLFFDVVRIINEKRPKAFLLENVKNLKSHDRGNTYRIVRETLDNLDYEVFDDVLDGRFYVPQHRERILIVGFDRKIYGKEIEFQFPVPPKNDMKLKDILEDSVDGKYTVHIKREKGFNFTINDYCRLEYLPYVKNGVGGPLYEIYIKNELFTKIIVHETNGGRRTIEITNPFIKIERDWFLHNYKIYYENELIYTCAKKWFEGFLNIEILNKNLFVHSIAMAVALDMLSHLD